MLSAKNSMLSASAQTLSVGDDLRQQVEDELEARRKKLTAAANGPQAGLSASLLLGAGNSMYGGASY